MGLNLGVLYTGGGEDYIREEKYFNLQSVELTLSCRMKANFYSASFSAKMNLQNDDYIAIVTKY